MASIPHYELPPPPPYPHYYNSHGYGNYEVYGQSNNNNDNLFRDFQIEVQPDYSSVLPISPLSPKTNIPHHIHVNNSTAHHLQNSQVQPNQIAPLSHNELPPPPPYPHHLLFHGYENHEGYPQSIDNYHNNSTPINNNYDAHLEGQNQEQLANFLLTSTIPSSPADINFEQDIYINSVTQEHPFQNSHMQQEHDQTHSIYEDIMPPPPPYKSPPPPYRPSYPRQEVQVDHWSQQQSNNDNNDVPFQFENHEVYSQSINNNRNASTPINNNYDLQLPVQNQEQQTYSDFTQCHGEYGQPNNNNKPNLCLPPQNLEEFVNFLLASTIPSSSADTNVGQDIYINSATQEHNLEHLFQNSHMQQENDSILKDITRPPPPYRPPPYRPPYPQQEVQVDHRSKEQSINGKKDVPVQFENRAESLFSAYALPITPPVASVQETKSVIIEPSMDEASDIYELAKFAKKFKQERIRLDFSQEDVCLAMKNQYRYDVPQVSLYCFETLNLSFKEMCDLKLILQKWLEDKRNALINSRALSKYDAALTTTGRRQRKRVASRTLELANVWKQNPHPAREEIAAISENLGMDREVDRVWFSSWSRSSKKRQKI